MRRFGVLAGFVLLCLAVGGVGGLVTAPAIPGWYAGLSKPAFNPPNWLFAPVWTLLYIVMGVAGWWIWKSVPAVPRARLLVLWTAQLLLNALWTPLFFGLHRVGLALLDIVLLDVSLLCLILMAWKPVRVAALLLMPYLAWTIFATALNAAILKLNWGT